MEEYTIKNGNAFTLMIENIEVCRLIINRDIDEYYNIKWTITSWYTKEGYGHKGYGTKLMQHAIHQMFKSDGKPHTIEYVWNGANQYVYNWLEKFDPVCKCPLVVLKTQNDDEWDAHIYVLNVKKFLDYFGVKDNGYGF